MEFQQRGFCPYFDTVFVFIPRTGTGTGYDDDDARISSLR